MKKGAERRPSWKPLLGNFEPTAPSTRQYLDSSVQEASNKTRRATQAAATIRTLATLFPLAFFTAQHERRPLKIGIADDLLIATANVVEPSALRLALRVYAGASGYLQNCRQGAPRLDLDGDACGCVSAGEAQHAMEVLAQRRNPAKTPPSDQRNKPPQQPRRLSLGDLRDAARAKREAASR
jgi:ProP effector